MTFNAPSMAELTGGLSPCELRACVRETCPAARRPMPADGKTLTVLAKTLTVS